MGMEMPQTVPRFQHRPDEPVDSFFERLISILIFSAEKGMKFGQHAI